MSKPSSTTNTSHFSRLPAFLVLLAALGLYVVLPKGLLLGPRYVIPVLEGILAVLLGVFRPDRKFAKEIHIRALAISLIALIALANLASVVLLVSGIVSGGQGLTGKHLVYSSGAIWLTNILVYGLWFWELDRGGPIRRGTPQEGYADLAFPQLTSPSLGPPNWVPTMIDYLYVALTNATAFSPTDTMPLSPLAKILMTGESLVSMVTVVMVAARAVNILH